MFLQIPIDSTLAPALQTAVSSTESFSLYNLLLKGGVIMIPIFVLFTIAMYIFIERLVVLYRATLNQNRFTADVLQAISSKNDALALNHCRESKLPIATMFAYAIEHKSEPPKEIEQELEAEGKFQVASLEKGLPILTVIAGIAPMFGFLGTIIGVIRIFFEISQTADVSITTVSAGLYVKMIASAAGLVVGIMAYIFYNWLNIRLSKIVLTLERDSRKLLDVLKKAARNT